LPESSAINTLLDPNGRQVRAPAPMAIPKHQIT
jgi:hypothetical protein